MEPAVDIGPHLSDTYDCDFRSHCWRHIPEYSIFNISRLSADKKWELYRNGIMKFEDIPEDYKLNVGQWQQVVAELRGETYIDKTAVRNLIDGLKYPLYFLDFESFQPAIPLFDHSHPYQQIVFQYSLHIQESENAPLKHYAFLADADCTDPRPDFIQQLIEDIGTQGDIIVYNRSFEASRVKEIATAFPIFHSQISSMISRIKDLMDIFQKRRYYVPEMQGSFLIKQVLPALVPGFSYKDLTINDGGTASLAFTTMLGEKDLLKVAEKRNNLLEYCKLDTLAMVEIIKVLKGV